MGGGDLNMKKSWHPLLLKNQERVWLEEKKALEEKKKLEQLRKEKEEERQLQELQRLQEEQTGKKRTEKLEWMYTTPATGSSQNPNDLEDYLLGKKRVDKILTADENAKIGASHKNFIAVQNANNARDIAAKIREDPLFAIKQQEQSAYQALLSNPLRLREMQERNGIKPKKSKEEKKRAKEEKKKLRHERRHRHGDSPDDRRIDSYRSSRDGYSRRRRSQSPSVRRSRSRERSSPSRLQYDPQMSRDVHNRSSSSRRPNSMERRPAWPPSDESEENDRGYNRFAERRRRSPSQECYERSPPPKRRRGSNSSSPAGGAEPPRTVEKHTEDRAARLAAMTVNANMMLQERQERLTALLEREKAELAADNAARERSKGMSNFLSQEQKKVFGGSGGLEDRIRRGRGGMVASID